MGLIAKMRPILFVGNLLLLRGTRRLIRIARPSDRRSRIVLHGGRRVSKAVAEPARSGLASILSILPIQVGVALNSELLQRRLVRRCDQKAAIERRVIHKLPLIVFLLVIEFADRPVFAQTRHAHNRRAAERCRSQSAARNSGDSIGGSAPARTRRSYVCSIRRSWPGWLGSDPAGVPAAP